MAWNRPTLQAIIDRIVADFESRITGASTFLRRSVIKIMGRVYGGAVHLVYGFLDYMSQQLFVTDMDDTNLDKAGAEYGLLRTDSTKSIGSAEATGTVGKTIPADTELQNDAGLKYIVDSDFIIGAGGTIDIDFTAELAGADYNDDAGVELTFISPIAGVDTKVTVDTAGIINGVNRELADPFRERILTRKRKPPHGGALFDYESWCLEISGNTRAWAFAEYNGNGTVGLAYARDNDTPIVPDSTERASTRAYIVEHTDAITGEQVGCPVGADNGLFMIALTLKAVDLKINIVPRTDAIEAEAEQKLADLLLVEGGPGQTIRKSQFNTAIGAVQNEIAHEIVDNVDQSFATNELPVLGTIIWGDYE